MIAITLAGATLTVLLAVGIIIVSHRKNKKRHYEQEVFLK